MKNSAIITVIAVLVVGGAAFFGGMQYQKTQAPATGNGGQFQRGGNGNRTAGGQGRLGGAVLGEIIAQDDKSITVKLQDGSSKIVLLSDKVAVTKTDTASTSDLKTGVRVGVFGMSNADGTVTAQNIQLNPMFRGSPSPR